MARDSAGRCYAAIYERVQRREDHGFLEQAVARSGARVLASTGSSTAPLSLSVEHPDGERLGMCAYVFHANQRKIRNRPDDEHRLQIRYGDVNDAAWRHQTPRVGFDPLHADVTVVLGAQPLIDSGQMVIFGPVLDDTGSWGLGVVEAQDEDGLRTYAAGDPVVTGYRGDRNRKPGSSAPAD